MIRRIRRLLNEEVTFRWWELLVLMLIGNMIYGLIRALFSTVGTMLP